MNGPDILRELEIVLKESCWLDKATEYMQQHPEHFRPASVRGLISTIRLSVSFQPETLQEVQTVRPHLFMELGNPDNAVYDRSVFNDGDIWRRTYNVGNNFNTLAEVRYEGSRDTGTQQG